MHQLSFYLLQPVSYLMMQDGRPETYFDTSFDTSDARAQLFVLDLWHTCSGGQWKGDWDSITCYLLSQFFFWFAGTMTASVCAWIHKNSSFIQSGLLKTMSAHRQHFTSLLQTLLTLSSFFTHHDLNVLSLCLANPSYYLQSSKAISKQCVVYSSSICLYSAVCLSLLFLSHLSLSDCTFPIVRKNCLLVLCLVCLACIVSVRLTVFAHSIWQPHLSAKYKAVFLLSVSICVVCRVRVC